MNFIKKNLLVLSLMLFMLVIPLVFVNANAEDCENGKLCNPLQTDTITDFLKNLLEGVIRIGIPIIALAIIYSGFLFVFARGNPSKIEEAKNAILYTLLGSALLLGSWALAQLISNTVLKL